MNHVFRTLTDSNGVTLNDNYRPPQALAGRTVYKRCFYAFISDKIYIVYLNLYNFLP